MFSPEQLAMLSAPLDARHVKQRSQAGRSLSYIEGWHAIAEANRIFGFDGWDRELVSLKQLGEPREVDGKFRVAYMATVRIRLFSDLRDIIRDGTGYGSGIDRDLGSAHESAIKEAETDAMKRALMTFGNPFGLALYDKTQANVVDMPKAQTQPQQDAASRIIAMIERSESAIDLAEKLHHPKVVDAMDAMSEADLERIASAKNARLAQLEKVAA